LQILHEFPDLKQLMARNFSGIRPAKPTIIIAMTPRTGSTQFCAALVAAGFRGRPIELFNPRGVIAGEKAYLKVESFEDYFQAAQAGGAREFIFKTSWADFEPFAAYYRVLFPDLRLIYLDRKDWAAQAVSQCRAEASNFWHQSQAQAKPPPESLRPKFDLKRARDLIRIHADEKRAWEAFFRAENLLPLRFEYQEIAADINAVLRKTAAAMELALRCDLPANFGFQKIGDWLSEEWRIETLKAELGLT
jgi:LPS sulfotransferase NodH